MEPRFEASGRGGAHTRARRPHRRAFCSAAQFPGGANYGSVTTSIRQPTAACWPKPARTLNCPRCASYPGRVRFIGAGARRIQVLWPINDDPMRAPPPTTILSFFVCRMVTRKLLLAGRYRTSRRTKLNRRRERTVARGADFLKVPHHGSRTSSTEPFVDSRRPVLQLFPWAKPIPSATRTKM